MFCTKCGAQLPEGTKFCPACGMPVEVTPSGNIFVRLWNNEKFGWVAVKMNRALNIIWFVFGIFLLLMGAWIFGMIVTLGGAFGIYEVWKRKQDRIHTVCPTCGTKIKIGKRFCEKCGTAIPVQRITPDTLEEAGAESSVSLNAGSLTGKKIGLIATVLVLPVLIAALSASGIVEAVTDPAVYNMKNAVWDDFGPQTLSEVVDDNFRGAEWTSDWLDDTSAMVYIQGYMPFYSENVRVTFFYEEQPDDGTFTFQIKSVDMLDSMESYTDIINIAFFLEFMYDASETASSAAAA